MHTIPMWRSEHALIFQMKISLGMYECVWWGGGGGEGDGGVCQWG